MSRNRKLSQRKLKRHHNFNEYWVCAICGTPRRTNTPKEKPCKRCRSVKPPRIRITSRRGVGDVAHRDSQMAKGLLEAANKVREGLRFGHGRFPPTYPAREILEVINGNLPNPKSRHWLCQVFLNGERYLGKLDREICFLGVVEEVSEAMLSDKKMMQIRISGDLHKWLKLHAAKNDTTMTEIIIQYLEYIRRRSEKTVKVEQI